MLNLTSIFAKCVFVDLGKRFQKSLSHHRDRVDTAENGPSRAYLLTPPTPPGMKADVRSHSGRKLVLVTAPYRRLAVRPSEFEIHKNVKRVPEGSEYRINSLIVLSK